MSEAPVSPAVVWEVINGYATRLDVTLFADGKEIEVTDNGRGIPVDVHPKYKKSALELILTTLHAGGKFEQGNYLHSGGLHGVGSSVVCALSSEMTVTVKRDGHTWQQTYAKGKATSFCWRFEPRRSAWSSGTFFVSPVAGSIHMSAREAPASGISVASSERCRRARPAWACAPGRRSSWARASRTGSRRRASKPPPCAPRRPRS